MKTPTRIQAGENSKSKKLNTSHIIYCSRIFIVNIVNVQKSSTHIMDKADKKNHYRDDLHLMQNIHFRFVRSIPMIGYSKEDNNGCHECGPLKRIDKHCRNNCQNNLLIKSSCFIENAFSSWMMSFESVGLFEHFFQNFFRVPHIYRFL